MNAKIQRSLIVTSLLLIVIIILMAGTAVITASEQAFEGPGGIGKTDLTAWFDASTGTYNDTGCTTAASAGGSVACWQDQGNNALQATQADSGKQPSRQINQLNGAPVIRFNDPTLSDDVLGTGIDSIDSLTTPFPTTDTTVFLVQKAIATQVQNTFAAGIDSNAFRAGIPSSSNANWDMGDISANGRLSYPFTDTANFYLWGLETESGSGQTIYQNGAVVAADGTAESFAPDGLELFIGAGSSNSSYFSGDIAELIIFNTVLSDINRTHVELYLRDKYDLDLSDAGIFTAPAAYNHNVRGISGSANIQDSDRNGGTAGLRVKNFSFLQEANDVLVFGHNNAAFDCCVTDNLAASAADMRWARLWSLDINDDTVSEGGWVDLSFDISDAGGSGEFSPTGTYYLLKRATGSSDDFIDVELPAGNVGQDNPLIVGDTITFRVLVSNLGSEFTLGSFQSPLAIGFASAGASTSSRPVLVFLSIFALLAFCTLFIFFFRRRASAD